ncbi:hypothetical protein Bphyt_2791 [Paraburkholderia phytofirmans PsJN]|uniref:Uncharacterized protein n=1 Tax=Paraburkholderia phytofirmans (strain DSM 17436 / LMG 22146 / PsJN) TaxID=398527 RepID=B2SZJ7_PARPJ|nr:hypothetical protein Bphyt_2791 [Paraburkholderia phytofirmans PsJN]
MATAPAQRLKVPTWRRDNHVGARRQPEHNGKSFSPGSGRHDREFAEWHRDNNQRNVAYRLHADWRASRSTRECNGSCNEYRHHHTVVGQWPFSIGPERRQPGRSNRIVKFGLAHNTWAVLAGGGASGNVDGNGSAATFSLSGGPILQSTAAVIST